MGDVEFFSFPPRAELAPFVETIWGVRGMGTNPVEAVVPNGAIELMVNFGPTQEVVGRGGPVFVADAEVVTDRSDRRSCIAPVEYVEGSADQCESAVDPTPPDLNQAKWSETSNTRRVEACRVPRPKAF